MLRVMFIYSRHLDSYLTVDDKNFRCVVNYIGCILLVLIAASTGLTSVWVGCMKPSKALTKL